MKSEDRICYDFSNRTSFSSQSDSMKKPSIAISKARRESSTYSTDPSSPLCNYVSLNNDIEPSHRIDEIHSNLNDKKINKEISTTNINDKEYYKNISNSYETIDEAKLNIVLCRICEEMILAENLSEHSKVCAVIQEQEMRLYECSQKLKKLNNEFKLLKNTMVKLI